jgi:acyl-CoA-binding protein
MGVFEDAAAFLRSSKAGVVKTADKLQFYALYKQATQGTCTAPKPYMIEMEKSAKWHAWHALGSLSKDEAIRQYIALLEELSPEWQETQLLAVDGDNDKEKKQKPEKARSGGGDRGLAPSMSVPVYAAETKVLDVHKTICDWAVDGNVDQVEALLTAAGGNAGSIVDNRDQTGSNATGETALMLAADRNHLDLVHVLIAAKANLNAQNSDGCTALHLACTCDNLGVIEAGLAAGADASITDADGDVPDVPPSQKAKY